MQNINKTVWVWRGSLLVLLAILSFLGSWVFQEVSAMPKTYPTKAEVQHENDRQDAEHRALETRINEGFEETQRLIIELHK